jgi:VCBS repeat-containing protein
VLECRLLLASPTANNDTNSVTHDTTLNAQNGVLLNDSDPDFDTLTATLVSGVSHGTLTLYVNGTFVYTPSYHYAGADSFTYKAFDGSSYSNVATVTINVTNSAPVGNSDSYTVYKDVFNTSTEGAAKVLANDLDQNGDPLTAILVSGVSHGTLTLNSDGSFSYTPTAGYYGTDSFVYKASDGIAQSANTTVTLTVTSPFSAQVNANDQPVAGLEDQGAFAASQLTGATKPVIGQLH